MSKVNSRYFVVKKYVTFISNVAFIHVLIEISITDIVNIQLELTNTRGRSRMLQI